MIQYIAITKRTIYHEGDERSRTNPGHGYPAYTESVDTVRKFTGEEDLKTWILSQDKNETYELYKVTPVTVYLSKFY